jgi:hypothetical protein
MKLDIVTSVWGEWHLSMYLSASLPTLLAPANLPALARDCTLRYRILTTPGGKRILERSHIFQQLAARMPVQISLIGESESPRNEVHLELMHASVQEAADRGAYLSIAPPDVIWPGNSLSNLLRILETRDPRAVSIPCIRVVSETLTEELAAIHAGAGTLHIDLSTREAQALVLRHLHPEQLIMLDGNPFSRPTLWATFPVEGGGILHCTFNREWFTVSPSRLAVTEIFCNDENLSERDYYVCQDAEEMLMLSLTPMRQYMADMRRDWSFHPIDVAATLRMKQHGVPFAWSFVRSPLSIGETSRNRRGWSVARRRANLWASSALVLMYILRVIDEIRRADRVDVANFIAYSIFESDVHRLRLLRQPITAVIPIGVVSEWQYAGKCFVRKDNGKGKGRSPLNTQAIMNCLGPAPDRATVNRLQNWRAGMEIGKINLVSFSNERWHLIGTPAGSFINDHPVRNIIVSDGNVVVLY